MIRYVDELIESLKQINRFPDMEVHINGCIPLQSIQLNADSIDLMTGPYKTEDEDLEDKISDLESELEEVQGELDDCKDALETVADSVEDICYNMNEYKKFHEEEWKVLGNLTMSQLEDFVKTCIDWYNIEDEVKSEC